MAVDVDPINGLKVVYKRPYEDRTFNFDLSADLTPDDDSVENVLEISFTKRGNVSGSVDLTYTTIALSSDGLTVQIKIAAGTADEDYKVQGRAQTVNGNFIEFEGMMYVREDIP